VSERDALRRARQERALVYYPPTKAPLVTVLCANEDCGRVNAFIHDTPGGPLFVPLKAQSKSRKDVNLDGLDLLNEPDIPPA